MKIAIIGTSGRKGVHMTKDLYEKMYKYLCELITDIRVKYNLEPQEIKLVSGGAAWSDHLAVDYYNAEHRVKLTLYVPCKWTGAQYIDNGSYSWKINPGKTANYYHTLFSKALHRDTLSDIQEAVENGCKIIEGNGFHDRNNKIAQCDIMIAFSWSESDDPNDGGTSYTWNKCGGALEKVHVSLSKL
ncbi:MAG TPA: hypothetical protein VLE02_01175 [Nitrosarchaeum sp.]|nr:hypothetical protein [Nitrosarchaeum sp.]